MGQAKPDRTGVIVVRAWKQSGNDLVRTRITARRDVLAGNETQITVAGAQRASNAVREWLLAFERDQDLD